MMNYYGGEFGFGMPFGFGILGLIFMLAWWGLIIWAIVLFVQWIVRSSNGHERRHTMSALDIAKARYAKGELNKEEYEEIKKELTK
jgi:putative membrane protein